MRILHGSVKMVVRAMDLFHVAIAIEAAAEALLSFDDDQIALAEAAGLAVLHLPGKQR
jgi:predicted nucleic acid-binding protein